MNLAQGARWVLHRAQHVGHERRVDRVIRQGDVLGRCRHHVDVNPAINDRPDARSRCCAHRLTGFQRHDRCDCRGKVIKIVARAQPHDEQSPRGAAEDASPDTTEAGAFPHLRDYAVHAGEDGVVNSHGQQFGSRAASQPSRSASAIRSCPIESRSRTVTASSSSDSKSTVMQNGVPISSWRR